MYYFISFYSKIFLKVVEHIKDSVQVLYKYTEFPENCQEKKNYMGITIVIHSLLVKI